MAAIPFVQEVFIINDVEYIVTDATEALKIKTMQKLINAIELLGNK